MPFIAHSSAQDVNLHDLEHHNWHAIELFVLNLHFSLQIYKYRILLHSIIVKF